MTATRRDFLRLGAAAAGLPRVARAAANKPNILFIAIDDLNDWIGCLGGYAGKIHSPNLDRLASRGVLFTNAHCAAPPPPQFLDLEDTAEGGWATRE